MTWLSWCQSIPAIHPGYQPGHVGRLCRKKKHAHLSRKLDPTLAQDVRLLERGLSSTLISKDPAFQLVASGRALASIGEWELAGFAFEKATRLNPNYAEAWAFLGEARRQTGLDGLQELQKAVHLDSQSLLANTLLGLYWQQSGRLDLALVYLDAAARQTQTIRSCKWQSAGCSPNGGNLQAALRRYQRAAEANPRPGSLADPANFTVEVRD
jgi:tetratricopeptide (TPR) repeat protein